MTHARQRSALPRLVVVVVVVAACRPTASSDRPCNSHADCASYEICVDGNCAEGTATSGSSGAVSPGSSAGVSTSTGRVSSGGSTSGAGSGSSAGTTASTGASSATNGGATSVAAGTSGSPTSAASSAGNGSSTASASGPAGAGSTSSAGASSAVSSTCGDVRTDPLHCGFCGNACPITLNAAPRCLDGHCGRGACAPGFHDVDGALTPGCESTCVGTACTLPGGGGITLTVPPPVERGGVFAEFHAGAALGAHVMSGGNLRNLGVLGGPPTAPVGESTGGNHRNVGAVVSLGP